MLEEFEQFIRKNKAPPKRGSLGHDLAVRIMNAKNRSVLTVEQTTLIDSMIGDMQQPQPGAALLV